MIRLIIWVAIFILILSFFGVSLKAVVNSPLTHENFMYVWQLIGESWRALLASLQHLVQH